MSKSTQWIVVGVVVLIVGAVAYGMGSEKARAFEEDADLARNERIEDRRRADSLQAFADSIVQVSEILAVELEEEKAKAIEAAGVYEENAEALERSAIRSGAEAREAVLEALTGSGTDAPPPTAEEVLEIIDRHLDEDRQANDEFRRTIESERAARMASERLVGVWQNRAVAFEDALDARVEECRSCKREADQWRRIAEPGFFEKIRRGIPWLGGGIVGGIVLVLVLL